MNKLYLIYVNHVGKDYKGNSIYEFIFSDSIKNIDGDDWDVYPASGIPDVPHDRFIKTVGKLESKLTLDVIQNSDTFAVWDAVDGVIALAWENINSAAEYPDTRIYFKFGDTQEEVEEKLYERDLILEFNKKQHEQKSN